MTEDIQTSIWTTFESDESEMDSPKKTTGTWWRYCSVGFIIGVLTASIVLAIVIVIFIWSQIGNLNY